MDVQEFIIYKITPKEGYRFHSLEDDSVYSDCLYTGSRENYGSWEEVIDPDYVAEQDGSYLHPFIYEPGMGVESGSFYKFDDENIWEAVKTGIESEYTSEWFDIVEV